MKKIFFLLLIILVTGCSNYREDKYYDLVDELKQIEKTTIDIPFDIAISIDKITETEVVYNTIIDNPQEEITNVVALVINDQEIDKMYPSIGIFDEKINLIPSNDEKTDDNVKGIALVGYLPFSEKIEEFSGTFKVYVEFVNLKGQKQKVYYIYKI